MSGLALEVTDVLLESPLASNRLTREAATKSITDAIVAKRRENQGRMATRRTAPTVSIL